MNTQELFHNLETSLQQHPATDELEKFGSNLKKNPLNKEELAVFFATLWPFFREVPTGILSLALRISDDWMSKYDEWDGTSRAASVLYANKDEFGIQSDKKLLPTHHQLFINLVSLLGLTKDNLLCLENIDISGKKLGQLTQDYYRHKSIPAGIGFHLASEFTSSLEFQYFLDGFKAHLKAYTLNSERQSALAFFSIHTIVEPLHLELGKKAANFYLEQEPQSSDSIEDGAMTFMNGFKELFYNLNGRLFNSH